MPVYILKQKTPDLIETSADPYDNREISADTEATGSITRSVPNGLIALLHAITKAYKPNNADWETGSVTVEVKVTTANANIFLAVKAKRILANNTVAEETAYTAEQQLSTTGVFTFTTASMNWSAGNCTDRLRITYKFRSSQSHGTAASVVIETGTTDTEHTTSITENAGTCRATFVKNLRQYKPDHKTIVAEGGTTNGDGVSNNIYLDSLIASRDNADKLTHKIEVEPVGTSFDNVANRTARQILYDPSSPKIRRSHSIVYDSVNKRYLLFGGWNGTSPRYNDVWELSADDRFGSSPPQWRKLNPSGTPPSARTTHLAFFDATGNRMIIHGGYDGADKNDTYAFDVTTRYSEAWSTLSPTGTAPTARSQAAGAFKASTRKAYIQGGLVGAGDYRNDLFELDLSTTNGAWTQLKAEDAAGNPPSRADASMVFDTANNRLLIFGGYDGTNRLNDLWRWDIAGASFAEVSDGTPPGVRQMHVAVYDENNPRMIVWGGRNGTSSSNYLSEIWELNTTSGSEAWTDRSQAAGDKVPGSRSSAACFDTANKIMVIFGGEDSALAQHKHVYFIDLATSGSAPFWGALHNNWLWGRDAIGYAYNPDRNETLIFGGFGRLVEDTLAEGEHTNEFWIYDHANTEWYQPILNTMFGISEREGATIIYDTNRDRYIIFGGLGGNNTLNNIYFNDVWELKASAAGTLGVYTLTKLNPSGTKPSARWLHAAVYDATNDRMIVFGGDDGSNFLNDVKALSFSGGADGAWSAITPTGTAPSARRQPAYAIDTGENVMLISHGATGVNSFAGDTFKLTLTSGSEAWGSVTGTGAPSARRGMTAIYRSTDDAFYFFGGYNGTTNFDELWKLTFGATPAWSQISDTNPPAGRRSHSGTYSPTGDKMLIYGGRDNTEISFNTFNQTWEYDIAGNTWTKKDPKIYIRGGDDVTGLASSTSYHWQSWLTGTSGGDSDKVSAFGNSESVADFLTGAGQAFTQTFNEIVAVADQVPKQAQKAANEVLLIVDSLARSTSRAFSEVLVIADTISNQAQKIFSEIIVVADSLIRQAQKNVAEVIAIVDSLLTQSTLFRTYSEIVTISDSLAKQTIRLLSEAISIVDSAVTKSIAKIFEETLTIADNIQRSATRTLNEVVAIIDTKVLQPIKTFVEAVVIADTLLVVKVLLKELNEAVSLVDSVLKSIGKFMVPEIVLVADSTVRLSGKNLQDTIIAADSIAKESRRNILESVLVADTSIRQGIKTFGEVVTLADSFLRTWTLQRVFDEIVVIADALSRQAQKAFSEALIIADSSVRMPSRIFSEIIALADAIEKRAERILSEIILIADSLIRTAGKLLIDAVAVVDSLTRLVQRSFAEIVFVTDTLSRQVQKMLLEILVIADSIINQLTATRIFTEIVSVADTILKLASRSLVEVMAVVDSVIRVPQKALNEAVTITDTAIKEIQRIFIEVVAVADSLIKQTIRAFSESVIIADTIQVFKVFIRDLAEVIAIVDSITKQVGRSLAEVVLLADSAIRSAAKSVSETIVIADSVIRGASRTFSEVVVIVDNLAREAGKTLADAIAVIDSLSAKITAKIFEEAVVVADSVVKQAERILSEIVSTADSLIRQSGKSLSDALTLVDTLIRSASIQRTLTEAISVIDAVAKGAERLLAEAVLIADSISKQSSRVLNEIIIIADSILKQGVKAFTEAVLLVDSVINQTSKSFAEAILIADALFVQKFQLMLTEIIVIADTLARMPQKMIQDAVAIGDAISRTIARTLIDTIAIADMIQKQTQRIFAEALIIVDSVRTLVANVLLESVAVIDTLSRSISFNRIYQETVAVVDSVIKTSTRIFAEAISITGSFAKFLTKYANLNEIVQIADSIRWAISKLISEIVRITEAWDIRKLLIPGIKVAVQLLAAKIGILLMSTRSFIELRKETKQTDLIAAKQNIVLKSAETEVEQKGAKKDITLYGQH